MTDSPSPEAPTGAADPKNLTPRRIALEAALAVEIKSAALDAALASHPEHKRLETRDRAFARAIAAAGVRRVGALDAALAAFMERPLPDRAMRARWVLRLAAAEILELENAAHAVVDAWVELMASDETTARYKGLANAVLRRVAEAGGEPFAAADPLADLPAWLAERWVHFYGDDVARAMAAARAGHPPLDVTVRPDLDPAEIAKALEGQVLPTGVVRRTDIGDVAALPGFTAGEWWAQDAAAALPVALLAPQPGERIADLCAAPGGKTLQIAAAGAETIAVDRSAKRLKRVEENLARVRLAAEIVAADAALWRPPAPLDAVLLDAPCTATGTLRRRPDVAWTKRPADIEHLAGLQARLLDAAWAMLAPGGRLVYCTCSLEPEEGEDQLARFVARTSDARVDRVRPEELPGLEDAIDSYGAVRTRPDMWPELGGLDGFFIARLTKART
ncbi:rRNA methyltransferase [Marinicauda salina]|uniref:rRNA methyltransferase n=1 Tax=Marinicauda salina TaxID=2135793 RepID=A0A2U2BVX1_9PROT|nr:RsmB/NOP family class I SAM-dependent RNA methyltransferase [Marinicauda salina]PWE18163.1 rRNA methyltransferase [Marinicauda salina]